MCKRKTERKGGSVKQPKKDKRARSEHGCQEEREERMLYESERVWVWD